MGNDMFIENSGWVGESETVYSRIEGNIIRGVDHVPMNDKYFGEGICSLNDEHTKFLRMTWRDNLIEILDSSLRVTEQRPLFDGPKEGWGITRHLSTLYVTDGSATIYLVDAETFEPLGTLQVRNRAGRP